jgi:hypothetical protein
MRLHSWQKFMLGFDCELLALNQVAQLKPHSFLESTIAVREEFNGEHRLLNHWLDDAANTLS